MVELENNNWTWYSFHRDTDYTNFLNMIGKAARSHFLRDDDINKTKQICLIHRFKDATTVFHFDDQENFLGTSLESM